MIRGSMDNLASLNDLADRVPRSVVDGDILDLGGTRQRHLDDAEEQRNEHDRGEQSTFVEGCARSRWEDSGTNNTLIKSRWRCRQYYSRNRARTTRAVDCGELFPGGKAENFLVLWLQSEEGSAHRFGQLSPRVESAMFADIAGLIDHRKFQLRMLLLAGRWLAISKEATG